MRFTTESGAMHPIDSAWHLFETLYQSGLYWKFLGTAQVLAGFLLMTQRYAKLGAIINLPIILNIFIITLSYYFALTPVVTGLILLANMLLLLWEWNELKILFNLRPQFDTGFRLENDKIWQLMGLLLFVFTFGYRLVINNYNIAFWAVTCLSIGAIGLIIGLQRERKRKQYLS